MIFMYAVIGASGFLGSYLIQSIFHNTSDNIIAAARDTDGLQTNERVFPIKCDITAVRDVEVLADIIRQGEPCKLIYTAAYHNLDLIAQNPKTSWAVNITALASFLNMVDNIRCFFFSSTDCVYGEGAADHRFRESDSLNPISLYGAHKAAAECLVNTRGYHVLRLPYMFGPSLSRKKKHFFDKIAEDLLQGKKVNLFDDSLRSSLDYRTIADTIISLCENYPAKTIPKIMNLCGDDRLSKVDLGIMLAKKLGVPEDLIVPVSSETFICDSLAKRALNGLMDNSLFKETVGLKELKINI